MPPKRPRSNRLGRNLRLLAALATDFGPHREIPLEALLPRYTTPASKWLPLAGTSLHYRDEGPRDARHVLILVHGTSSSLHTWDGWVEQLSGEFRVIRMDLPGFGLTGPRPDQDYSIEAYVEVIHALSEALGVSRFALAGNSLGGLIAWRCAHKYPRRVEQLVLLDAGGYPFDKVPMLLQFGRLPLLRNLAERMTPRAIVEQQVYAIYGDPTRVNQALVDRYRDLLLREGNRKAFGLYARHTRLGDSAHLIPEIRTPTLILWGDRDRLIPVATAERFHRDLPGSRLIIYPGVGHVPMEEIPEQSARDLRAFILDPPSSRFPRA